MDARWDFTRVNHARGKIKVVCGFVAANLSSNCVRSKWTNAVEAKNSTLRAGSRM